MSRSVERPERPVGGIDQMDVGELSEEEEVVVQRPRKKATFQVLNNSSDSDAVLHPYINRSRTTTQPKPRTMNNATRVSTATPRRTRSVARRLLRPVVVIPRIAQ